MLHYIKYGKRKKLWRLSYSDEYVARAEKLIFPIPRLNDDSNHLSQEIERVKNIKLKGSEILGMA
jgi:hypothetical protein